MKWHAQRRTTLAIAGALTLQAPGDLVAQGPARAGLSQHTATYSTNAPTTVPVAASGNRQRTTTLIGAAVGLVAGYMLWKPYRGDDDSRWHILVIFGTSLGAIGALVGYVVGSEGPPAAPSR